MAGLTRKHRCIKNNLGQEAFDNLKKHGMPERMPNVCKWFKKGNRADVDDDGIITFYHDDPPPAFHAKFINGEVKFSRDVTLPGIEIDEFTGSYSKDKRKVIDKIGKKEFKRISKEYDWHHGSKGEMIPVLKSAHSGVAHKGGAAAARAKQKMMRG